MKSILYVLIALVMGLNFTSCSTDPIDEEFPVEATVGEDSDDPEEEDPDS